MLKLFSDKQIKQLSRLSLVEEIVLLFLKTRTITDTETTKKGYTIIEYKTWRGKTYITFLKFVEYDKV